MQHDKGGTPAAFPTTIMGDVYGEVDYMAFKDLTGQRFGRLTVIDRADTQNSHVRWRCRCDCGNITIVKGIHLKNGHTKSCGCLIEEATRNAHSTHSLSKTRIYETWCSMKSRCLNPQKRSYKNYGGRGITVCDEWQNDFRTFYDWAIKSGYRDDLMIDRIDVNGNYEPSNCRWADRRTQNNNRRNNHYLTHNGETKTMRQWADDLGISYYVLRSRINNSHWSVERALNEPIKGAKKYYD